MSEAKDYVSAKHKQEMEEYYALYPGDAGRELKGCWEHKFALMRECNAKSERIAALESSLRDRDERVKALEIAPAAKEDAHG